MHCAALPETSAFPVSVTTRSESINRHALGRGEPRTPLRHVHGGRRLCRRVRLRQVLRKLLVGVDGTPSARDAVVLARALAAADNADIVLVGAYTDPLLPFPLGLRRDTHLARDVERLLLAVREELAPSAR